MIIIFHIFVALAGVACSTLLFFVPSNFKLRLTYGLVALTLASGTYLVASKPAHIVQACMTGLLYLGFVSVGIAKARYTLASEKSRL